MDPIPEFKQIERRAYWSYHQDAIIAFGFTVVNFMRESLAAIFVAIEIILMAMGCAVLVRFLQKYFLPGKEA